MAVCPGCGAENPERARFCWNCAAAVKALAPVREVRKTVTVLFSDVSGSTALGERLDPESLRTLMGRYFAEIKRVIESHGGTVEKFVGDAVMAVFGIPTVHEDDALRAVRAAAMIRDTLATLDQELITRRGIALSFRTGITTGEVVAGDPATGQTLVTGDTVNTAARLEQAGQPGEILIGLPTFQLVRDAVTVEPVEPIRAKGKADPLVAFRLVSVSPGTAGHVRRLDTPLVGRQPELDRLSGAFEAAVRERSCQLFTVLGTAGVGKSRLLAEFLASVAPAATILKGRCLPYGEGITYWPLREIVHQVAGIDEGDTAAAAIAKVAAMLGDDRDADVLTARLASAIGLSVESTPQEEIFWATRRLLEHLARKRPVVILVEDIHWAEPALLDLLEHIADLTRDAPLLMLCAARPELLDKRPGWGGGKFNTTTVLLEALASDSSDELIDALPGGKALPASLRSRILDAAEGNPLYLEEMLSMLVDEHLLVEQGGAWRAEGALERVAVPPTVHALLAARLDQLSPTERQIAERASVVGRVFEQAAVNELSSEALRPEITRGLVALVRKELVRPERSELAAGDAFKFRHLLIRDAAYEALPKSERAELHERFANWLWSVAGERAREYEEIVGYHLEQAYNHRLELMETAAELEGLALRAADHLESATRRALDRSDLPAARGLLDRAVRLLPAADPRRARWLADSVDVDCQLGDLRRAAENVEQLGLLAETSGSDAAAWHSLSLHLLEYQLGQFDTEDARRSLAELVTTFTELGDELGLTRTYLRIASVEWLELHGAAAIEALQQARSHARRAGAWNDELGILAWLTRALAWGPTPADPALVELDKIEREAGADRRLAAGLARNRAFLLAMKGQGDEAMALHERAVKLFEELGMAIEVGESAQTGTFVAEYAGEPGTARRWQEESCELLQSIGEAGIFPTNALFLTRTLTRAGELDEAAEWLDVARRLASSDDIAVQAWALTLSALLNANRGDHAKAIEVSAAALAFIESAGTDFQSVVAASLSDLAEALEIAGQPESAISLLERVQDLHVSKGNLVGARRAKQRLLETSRAARMAT